MKLTCMTLALVLVSASCATAPTMPKTKRTAVAKIAQQLVEAVEVRRDPQELQIYLGDIPRAAGNTLGASTAEAVSQDLRHHLLMSINTKLNVLERDMTQPPSLTGNDKALSDWAKTTGATHVLLGDWVVRKDDICISLRLVDLETKLIVAAAGGMVPGEAAMRLSALHAIPRSASYRRR